MPHPFYTRIFQIVATFILYTHFPYCCHIHFIHAFSTLLPHPFYALVFHIVATSNLCTCFPHCCHIHFLRAFSTLLPHPFLHAFYTLLPHHVHVCIWVFKALIVIRSTKVGAFKLHRNAENKCVNVVLLKRWTIQKSFLNEQFRDCNFWITISSSNHNMLIMIIWT